MCNQVYFVNTHSRQLVSQPSYCSLYTLMSSLILLIACKNLHLLVVFLLIIKKYKHIHLDFQDRTKK